MVAARAVLICLAAGACAGQTATDSGHRVQFVTVDENVRLEVLDWGGSGRSVVLLAGLGNTAHVFDDFAPKLAAAGFHVFGITRRGFGVSSAPGFGYSADRLGDDVLAVIGALKLDRPVLAGNALAGEELSSVGSRHPEKVAGLIYLDAAYSYAYYDRTRGDLFFDLLDVEKKLAELHLSLPAGSPAALKQDLAELRKEVEKLLASNGLPEDPRFAAPVRRLLETKLLAAFEKDAQEEEPKKPQRAEPSKRTQDRKRLFDDLLQTSLPRLEADLRDAQAKPATAPGAALPAQGWNLPQAELRLQQETKARGHGGAEAATQAILQGRQKYTYLRVPILAIYCLPHQGDDPSDPHEVSDEAQAQAFEKGVRSARVVRLPHANRLVFLSNEADVLREMKVFLESLKAS